MTNREAFDILCEAWEMSSKTQHDYLTSYDKRKVERLLDLIEEIVEFE